jgi:hypothetical protein
MSGMIEQTAFLTKARHAHCEHDWRPSNEVGTHNEVVCAKCGLWVQGVSEEDFAVAKIRDSAHPRPPEEPSVGVVDSNAIYGLRPSKAT